jgi:hypothetical protein
MTQVYCATKVTASKSNSSAITGSSSLNEIEVRTIWGGFVLDKLLSCGRQRPTMVQLEEVDVRLPQGEQDFVFGNSSTDMTDFTHLVKSPALRKQYATLDFHFQLIIRGLDIWSQIHSWVVEGGRKLPGMTDKVHCPWKQGSRWAQLKHELEEWRGEQAFRLKYPETKVSTHAHFGQAEVFTYINLIYHLR